MIKLSSRTGRPRRTGVRWLIIIYLDVSDSDNRIHRRDGVWLADKGYELYPVGEVSWEGAIAYCK